MYVFCEKEVSCRNHWKHKTAVKYHAVCVCVSQMTNVSWLIATCSLIKRGSGTNLIANQVQSIMDALQTDWH